MSASGSAGAGDTHGGGRTVVEGAAGQPTYVEGAAGAPPGATVIEGGGEHGGDAFVRTNLPPDLREHYEVVREIPVRGAEADLLVVRDRRSGEEQVAKLYRLGVARANEGLLAQLAAARKEHVVTVHERGISGGAWYEVMELCREGSLVDLIRREGPKLPPARVEQILREVAPALEHIHAPPINITHRDLKPANILVRTLEPFDLVLADFGLATVLDDVSKKMASGSRTPAYAAPEAAFGIVSHKLDWWSLGVTVIEMLTGRHPLITGSSGEGDEKIISAHISTVDLPLDGIEDRRWRALCAGLTTRNPDHRWTHLEVTEWLAGGSPRVWRAAETKAAKAPPFSFRSLDGSSTTQYRDPVEIAAALGRNWDEALGVVRNDSQHRRQNKQLRDFLEKSDMPAARAVLTSTEGTEVDRLLRLRLAIDPDAEPVYDGVDLGDNQLSRLAANAVSGDARSATVLQGVLDHGVLTLFDGGAGREGWAALEASWAENVEWLERELPARTELDGAEDLDDAARATNAARLLLLLLEDGRRDALARDADAHLEDARAATVDWYGAAVGAIAGGPRPAHDLVVTLLHNRATALVDEREAEERAAEEARRRRQREQFGRACASTAFRTLLFTLVLAAAGFAGLAFGLLQVPHSGYAITGDGARAALDALLPAGIGAFVVALAASIAYNVMTFARGTADGYAAPAPRWHAATVVVAAVVPAVAAILDAAEPGRVSTAVPAWMLGAAAAAHVACLLLRTSLGVLSENARVVARTLAPPLLLVALAIVAALGAIGANHSAEERVAGASDRLAATLPSQACAGNGAEDTDGTTGWLEARATCRSGRILLVASRVDRRDSADALVDALARREKDLAVGAPCSTQRARRRWRQRDVGGTALCFRHGAFAHITYSAPGRRLVIELRRRGKMRVLQRWWQRHARGVVLAASRASA